METQKEITAAQAVVRGLCPRCRTGQVFSGPAYGRKRQLMLETCPHCELRYEREPGYFYVAMFVSYALIVAELVAACVAAYVLFGNTENPWVYTGVALVVGVGLSPVNFRYSRLILLHWLTPGLSYEPELAGKSNNPTAKS
ncbi:DUF983 domain-containing protein [Parapedobacter lycopersici]|uniref:DUF983 domain-containing protein n=1 Tax=Parapedobacter lycopersici TaxID=1864939 RepID=UPI0033420F25